MPGNSFWESTQNIFMLIGLGCFTFISGLLVDLRYSGKIRSFSDVLDFYKNRAIRILPLNWLSIVLFVTLTFTFVPFIAPNFAVHYPKAILNFLGLLCQFTGTQLLLQNFYSYNWFVGLIVVCYFVYPMVIRFSKNTIQAFTFFFSPFLILVLLRLTLGLIDDRLLIFYMIFVGGVLANQFNQSWNDYSHKKMALFLVLTVVSSFVFYWRGGADYYYRPLFGSPFIDFVFYRVVILDIAAVSACMSSLLLLNRNRISAKLEKFRSLITFVAVSSYCVYLFHFIFFTVGKGLFEFFKLPILLSDFLFYLLIVPTTFILSYYIQTEEEAFWKRLSNFRFWWT
jgi:peptidoglycan/LPS O-acetylase OafA/YrhL